LLTRAKSSEWFSRFLFVVTLGVVAYALVRPFTHREHEHRSDLWVHLP
jgi:hypothetical protein